MRVLLVVPRLTSAPGQFMEFPLGLAYISSVLKKAGHEVKCLDLNIRWGSLDDEMRSFVKFSPQLIGTGGLSPYYSAIQAVLVASRKIIPSAIRVVGGSVLSGDPKTSFTILDADIGVIGEGEITMLDLAARIDGAERFSDVLGLVTRGLDGSDVFSANRAPIEDLDSLPMPDYKGFNLNHYLDLQSVNDGLYRYQFDVPRSAAVLTSRSCPLSCTFCFHPLGQKFRTRGLDSCFAEIEHLKDHYGINSIAIQDELFTTDKDRLYEFCGRIGPLNLKWNAPLRLKGLDLEMFRTMKENGCFCVACGIESMSHKVLSNLKKHVEPHEIEAALNLIRKSGLNVVGNMIFGDEAETEETAEETLSWWRMHPEFNIALRFITPYPGSELYRNSVESNKITDPADYIKSGCPVINMTRMDKDGFGRLLAKVWGHHVNPTYHLKAQKVKCLRDDVSSLAHENDLYDIDFTCPSCSDLNSYKGFAIKSNMIHGCLPTIVCRICNQKMLLFDYPQSSCSQDLQNLIKEDSIVNDLYKEWGSLQGYSVNDWLRRMTRYLDPQLLQEGQDQCQS